MQTKEEAIQKIKSLVERFDEQIESYKRADYNETQTRRDFIDPFWRALGWDVDNENGYAESYREVIHEDRIKVGKATKAPDYSFRLPGGKRMFFLEAKKPSVAIKDDIEPAYQIRRYGWSAKMPISVITDFEEFAIYDCTNKPKPTDKASNGRIKYITYIDYIKEFDFIWDTFSKERVLKGSFDKYIQSDKNKKGTTTVDHDFLASLDKWRIELAKNIALRNKEINEEELNFVVQSTLDRIIFLRIAEDRSAERYGGLQGAIKSGDYYKNLLLLFHIADQKYNSGLFDFRKDKISNGITLDNKIIKSIISELYYPLCPYEFSVLSVEIMGSAYEQFLGKQISLSKSGRATIEEKPEVRKAGGVYYTPQYIVDYIVKNTVGKLVENKTPKEVSQIKIVDPACGSGSFLIGAYQFLLNWHKDFYTQNGKLSKGHKNNPLTPTCELTTAEKKRILLNNIYGVDIDSNAVEVTKLSLLLKCMEGETLETIESQQKLFHDRILPTLDNNIKNGNSLIDLDYYDSQLDFGDERKIKPFAWQKSFPEVFDRYVPVDKRQPFKEQYDKVKKMQHETNELITSYILKEPEAEYLRHVSGFDCVIGNPPYVLLQCLETKDIFNYSLKKFESAKYKIDTYQLFIEQSVKLLRQKGLIGFITPNTFLKNIHAEPLRKFILKTTKINEFLLLNYPVFSSASVDTCVFVFEKGAVDVNSFILNISNSISKVEYVTRINQQSFLKNRRSDFNLSITNEDSGILEKITRKALPLSTYCEAYFGIQTFDRTKYVSKKTENEKYEPVIDGANIEPYKLKPTTEYVYYTPKAIKSGGKEIVYRQERICIRQIGTTPVATLVPASIFTLNTIYNVFLKQLNIIDLRFLLGIINSKATKYYWKKNNSDEKKTFPKIKKEAILSIPVPTESAKQPEIIKYVDQLLQLNKELQKTTLPSQIEQLKSRIEYSEDRINEIVYELYGLTEEEINIIEKN